MTEKSHIRNPERYFFYTNGRKEKNISNVEAYALGLFDGILSDGKVCDLEIVHVYEWLCSACGANKLDELLDVREVIAEALDDGHIDEWERDEITERLQRLLINLAESPADETESERNRFVAILRGVMSDGKLSPEEYERVIEHSLSNQHAQSDLVNTAIFDTINKHLLAGFLDENALEEARLVINSRIGGSFEETGSAESRTPKDLLVDSTIPSSIIGMRIAVTGKLISGFTRTDIKHRIIKLGGIPCGVSKKIQYLAVAGLADARYKYETHGQKVADVLELNQKGANIGIVDADALWEAMKGMHNQVEWSADRSSPVRLK